jgi:galactokinase/mevalonate kinase-like predicted kinase
MSTAEAGVALARAALAGNPSDGYGGAVLAVTLPGQAATASAELAPAEGPSADPPSELVETTIRRFARHHAAALHSRVRWHTTIPRGVGLGGSSAIVIATLRALCARHEVTLPEARLAAMALAVETEDLGIAAGLQDRVAQAYGGLTFMEFSRERYERLDPQLLPPLVVAWRTHTAEHSGRVHGDLRSRFERGDDAVRRAMDELADLARSARAALLAGDHEAFCGCVDGSFEVRAGMLALDPAHVEMIEAARGAGAAANYTGSGGAIVSVCRDEPHRARVRQALAEAGCGVWTS